MRCKNCGFPNRPGQAECVKCHTPLDASEELTIDYQYERSPRDIGATIPEGMAQFYEERVCPKCGYPLRDNSSTCPNCNYAVANYAERQPEYRTYRQEVMDNPAKDKNLVVGTINPYKMEVESAPAFVLRPVIRQNEKKEVTDLRYEGKEVQLNRGNTEEDNTSITSHIQATLTHTEGHWYVEDKSEQGTTFVRATSKVELHEGDVILLGNRLFEFHIPAE